MRERVCVCVSEREKGKVEKSRRAKQEKAKEFETHTQTSEASQQKEPVEGLRAPGSSSRKRGMYLVSKNTHRTCVRFARTERLDQPAMSMTISRFAQADSRE